MVLRNHQRNGLLGPSPCSKRVPCIQALCLPRLLGWAPLPRAYPPPPRTLQVIATFLHFDETDVLRLQRARQRRRGGVGLAGLLKVRRS